MFVTIEGPEGSGKSSVTKEVVKRWEEEGYEVILTREPGGTPIAEQIRNVILDISDRFLDSSLAYQGGARGLGIDKILALNQYATDGYYPELTLLFDVDPRIGLARIAANKGREVNRLDLEKIDFHDST